METASSTPVVVESRFQLSLRLLAGAVIACSAIGLAGAIAQRNLDFLRVGLATGLVLGGLEVIIVVNAHDFLEALERWTGRDIDGDQNIGESEYVEPTYEFRADRALDYIANRGGTWTREHLCDEKGLFSQAEWAQFFASLKDRHIIDAAGKALLPLTYKEARQLWDKGKRNSFEVLPGGKLIKIDPAPQGGDGGLVRGK